MATQVDQYLALNRPTTGSELFVLWGGANDFFQGQTDPAVPSANIAALVRTLHAAGAQQFLVLNLPPLGQTPAYLDTPDEGPMDARTIAFNAALAEDVAQLRSDLGVSIEEVDAYGLFRQVVADPAAYGLTNVTQAAFADGNVVPNPDQYLFWDDVHPTRVVHRLLADSIPEPTSLALLLAGAIGGLAWVAGAKRSMRQ
jgi:phospholipase/lecithinase/hemolysin